MNWSIRRVAGNIFSLASGEVLQRLLSLTLVMTIARKLGASQMGIYNSCTAYMFTIITIINFGFDEYIAREAAKYPERANQIFESVTGAKSSLYLIIAPIVIIASIMFLPALKWRLILILILLVLFNITTSTVYAFFRAKLMGHFQSAGYLITRIIASGSGLLLVLWGIGITGLVFAETIASMIMCIVSLIVLKKNSNTIPKKLFSFKELKLYTTTWKFGLLRILFGLSTTIAMMMLSALANDKSVGLFSAAEKLTLIVSFVPTAITSTMLPVFSRLSNQGEERYKSWLLRYFTFQVIAGTFICALFASLSSFLPGLIFGSEFIQIRPVVLILSPLFISVFVNPVFSIALITKNKEGVTLTIYSISTAVNIILCFLLIPYLREKGAAIAVLSSSILNLLLLFVNLKPDIRKMLFSFKILFFPLTAAAACFGLWHILELHGYSILITASSGVAAFIAVIVVSGTIKLQDFNTFVNMVKNGKS